MKSFFSNKEDEQENKRIADIAKITLIIISLLLFVIGISFSLFFTKEVNKFFYKIRTAEVVKYIEGEFKDHIKDSKYFDNWKNKESQQKLDESVNHLKTVLNKMAIVNVYNKDKVLIWSDFYGYQRVIGEKYEVEDVEEALNEGIVVQSPSRDIVEQIGIKHLLEIYTPVYLSDTGSILGVVEVYLDISDISDFLWNFNLFILFSGFGSFIIIFLILRFVFNKQNKKIQEYSFDLEKKVRNRTKELQEKVEELEKIQKLTVGREVQMVQLKKEVEELKNKNN